MRGHERGRCRDSGVEGIGWITGTADRVDQACVCGRQGVEVDEGQASAGDGQVARGEGFGECGWELRGGEAGVAAAGAVEGFGPALEGSGVGGDVEFSQAGAAISTVGNTTLVTLNGRVLSLGASITMVDTVINVPAP